MALEKLTIGTTLTVKSEEHWLRTNIVKMLGENRFIMWIKSVQLRYT